MSDINIRLPLSLNNIIKKIDETNYFSDAIVICKFAFAYAIKHHFEEIDPVKENDSAPADGMNWNVGSFDADKFLYNFVMSAYPNCESPYGYARGIIIFGLRKLENKLKNNTTISFNDLI